MRASIFPAKGDAQAPPVLPAIHSGPAMTMTREFIDSRDKSYSHPSARGSSVSSRPGGMQSSQSAPFLSSSMGSPAAAPPYLASPGAPAPHSSTMANNHSSFTYPPIPQPTTQPTTQPAQQSPYTTFPSRFSSPLLSSPASFTTSSPQQQPSPASPYLQTPPSATTSSLRAPKISGARLSPNPSVEDLRLPQRSSTTATNGTAASGTTAMTARSYTLSDTPMADAPALTPTASKFGGSTARSSGAGPGKPHSPLANAGVSATIGTPYQATSPLFPLPQHVSVRPKTAGALGSGGPAMSRVAGVDVPTHHTSAARASTGQPDDGGAGGSSSKTDKRKTRLLLNPMALLLSSSRRKSAAPPESAPEARKAAERSTAALAYARQRTVAANGVGAGVGGGKGEDFDPRIRGNRVHDFGAPRQGVGRRGSSYNDAELPGSGAGGSPSVPTLQWDPHQEQNGGHSKNASESSSGGGGGGPRRSVHSPHFREHLGEETATERAHATRVSPLNAERLENKHFLQRVSQHSSSGSGLSGESATALPPFARRSQVLDLGYEGLEAGKRGSGGEKQSRDRESGVSEGSAAVSPIMAGLRSQEVDAARRSQQQSHSPVSPNTPSEKGFRPISAVSDFPPAPSTAQSAPSSPHRRDRTTSEATARPLSDAVLHPVLPSAGDLQSPALPTLQRPRNVYRDSANAPEALPMVVPDRRASLTPDTLRLP
ncbi:hypothetical protein LTR53_017793, partial [Teratosphaeriaceae sp. CCFEE 6253]